MPSPPATYRPYMRGVYVAYAVLTWCYFGVGITGYWAFGEPPSIHPSRAWKPMHALTLTSNDPSKTPIGRADVF